MAATDSAPAVAAGMRSLLERRRHELAGGAEAVGWKIGINVAALQAHLGLSGPVVGYLNSSTARVAPDGAEVEINLGGWSRPALEVEVAITVGAGLSVSALAPALELVDLDVDFNDIESVLATNVCHRAVIFGPERRGLDVTGLTVAVFPTGVPEAAAAEARAEGTLLEAPELTVGMVAEFLAAHGAELLPGQRIIAGSLITPLTLEAGDRFTVSFGSLGTLALRATSP